MSDPRALDQTALRQLIQRLAPDGRLVRMKRLRGGLGSLMHAMLIERADRTRFTVSLRRYGEGEHRYKTPEHAVKEFKILRAAQRAGLPAPAPLLLDAQGEYFGCPTLVLSYLPGRPLVAPAKLQTWTSGLAATLIHIHQTSLEYFSQIELERRLGDATSDQIARRRDDLTGEALAKRVHAEVSSGLKQINWSASLIHDDYWPGNVIWYRGKVKGIIDWTTVKVGDPRADVSQCRTDLVLTHSIEAADKFLEDYESLAGVNLEDLAYFDLLRGLGALLSYDSYLGGYQDIGLRNLTLEELGERLRWFLARAIEEWHSSR